MKKNRLLSLCAAFASILASCDMNEMNLQTLNPVDDQVSEKRDAVITASMDEVDPLTRTSRGTDGLIYWSPADEIMLFSAGETAKFVSQNSEPVKTAQFKGQITFVSGAGEDGTVNYIWALYPYMEDAYYDSREDAVVTTMPAFQKSLAKTFSDKTAISLGKSTSMAFSFKNAYSGLRVRFYRDDIVSVTVSGMDGENLAGKVAIGLTPNPVIKSTIVPEQSITMIPTEGTFLPTADINVEDNDYYIITLPDVELQRGLAITVRRKDGYEATYYHSTDKLERNRFKNLKEALDTRIENPENISDGLSTDWHPSTTQALNEIWYTSAEDKLVEYTPDPSTGNEVIENIPPSASSNGMGIIRFAAPLTQTDPYAFGTDGNEILNTIDLPESVEIINGHTFYHCSFLNGLNIIHAKTISKEACIGCSIQYLFVGNSLETLEGESFIDCLKLEEVSLPESLKSIGKWEGSISTTSPEVLVSPFINCPSIREFKGKYASADGRALIVDNRFLSFATKGYVGQTFVIPDNVRHIMMKAFNGAAIGGVILPEGLETIYDAAFAGCGVLKEVVIPSSVQAIYSEAFKGCSSMKQIEIMKADRPMEMRSSFPEFEDNPMVFHGTNDCPIYVPGNLLRHYTYSQLWDTYGIELGELSRYRDKDKIIIEFTDEDVKAICVANWDTDGDGELSQAEASLVLSLDSQSASTRVSSGRSVFAGTPITSFNELAFFTGLTEIMDNAFEGCGQLESITFPKFITHIGNHVFQGCISLLTLFLEALIPPTVGEGFFDEVGSSGIVVPDESVSDYQEDWDEVSDAIHGSDYPMAVDLGLSVKWASFNLGATCPEQSGKDYCWGMTVSVQDGCTYDWVMEDGKHLHYNRSARRSSAERCGKYRRGLPGPCPGSSLPSQRSG